MGIDILLNNYNYFIKADFKCDINTVAAPVFDQLTESNPISNISQYTKLLYNAPQTIQDRIHTTELLVLDHEPILPALRDRLHVPKTLESTHLLGYWMSAEMKE